MGLESLVRAAKVDTYLARERGRAVMAGDVSLVRTPARHKQTADRSAPVRSCWFPCRRRRPTGSRGLFLSGKAKNSGDCLRARDEGRMHSESEKRRIHLSETERDVPGARTKSRGVQCPRKVSVPLACDKSNVVSLRIPAAK